MILARIVLALPVTVVLGAAVGYGQPADVPKTNPMKVYMHYMPWFETPDTLGPTQWGFHWTFQNQDPNIVDENGKRQIAAHYYPKIGPYASSDDDVIEYHLLLMKLSGVDGILIDWYGVQGTNGDIGELLTNSNAVVDRVGDFGLEFGVVLEDRFAGHIEHTKANVRYLRDNYFPHPQHIRRGPDDDPLLLVFGPITFEQPFQWTEILAEAGQDVEFLTLWYESHEAGSNAGGEYAWIYEDAGLNNHLAHVSNFYRFRSQQLEAVGGIAYPGFVDFYEEGGLGPIVHFEIPHDDGETLADLLDLANEHSATIDFLQLATWNDFGEGTMFEPTVETGFDYLLQVQEFTGVPFGESELHLVYRLYLARKQFAGDGPVQAMLDQASTELAALQIGAAADILDSVAPPGDYTGDGVVDTLDYAEWRANFGASTILFGDGADGNFDGVINAADYTVWRDNLAAGPGHSLASTLPEPATQGMLVCGLAAFLSYRNRSTHRGSRSRVRRSTCVHSMVGKSSRR